MTFATRAFTRIDEAPFLLYCDTFVRAIHPIDSTAVTLKVDGPAGSQARLALVPKEGSRRDICPGLATKDGQTLPLAEREGRLEAWVPCGHALLLDWGERA